MLTRTGMDFHFVQGLRQLSNQGPAQAVSQTSQNLLYAGAPVLRLASKQALEALQTGGVGARIPIIQRAVEAATAAGGQVAEKGRQLVARAGLGGSPFAVASELGTQKDVSAAIAGIPAKAGMEEVSRAPQIAGATYSAGLSAAQLDQQRREFNIEMYGQFMEDIKSSIEFWQSSASQIVQAGRQSGVQTGGLTQSGDTSGFPDYGTSGGTPDVSEFV